MTNSNNAAERVAGSKRLNAQAILPALPHVLETLQGLDTDCAT